MGADHPPRHQARRAAERDAERTAERDRREEAARQRREAALVEREQQEAERKKIEAEGVRDAQKVLADGLSEEIIEWRSLEVFERLASSPNAKLIITDGDTPVLINQEEPSAKRRR